MSYEINILSINQKKPVAIPSKSSIILLNEIDNPIESSRYFEIWPFFSSTNGILYTLVTQIYEDFYSALPFCDTDFNAEVSNNLLPIWIPYDAKYNMTPLIILEQYYINFISIIKHLILSSPNKTIMFQSRYQDGDSEIIFGVITLTQFINMLNKKEILFNVCYIVKGDEI